MTDNSTTQPVVVSSSQGLIDGIQAAARYAVVIIGFTTSVLALVKTKDIAGLIVLIRENGGQVLGAVTGLVALGTAAYGVFKTKKRGAEVAAVAASPKVPDSVAKIKE